MIDASCDSCGKSYRLSEERAGRMLRCKRCGEGFRVPEPDEAEYDEYEYEGEWDEGYEEPARPEQKQRGRKVSSSARSDRRSRLTKVKNKAGRKNSKSRDEPQGNPNLPFIIGGVSVGALVLVGLLIFLMSGNDGGDTDVAAAGGATGKDATDVSGQGPPSGEDYTFGPQPAPPQEAPWEADPGGHDITKLREICRGFERFRLKNKHYPPPEPKGSDVALLSWRVHLLPFIDQAELYNEFKLDEPHDSPHNAKLLSRMPDVYKSSNANDEGKTCFRLLGSENATFSKARGPGVRDLTYGRSNFMAVVMVPSDGAADWTDPALFPFDENNAQAALEVIDDCHLVSTLGGSVVKVPAPFKPENLAWYVRPSGRKVPESQFRHAKLRVGMIDVPEQVWSFKAFETWLNGYELTGVNSKEELAQKIIASFVEDDVRKALLLCYSRASFMKSLELEFFLGDMLSNSGLSAELKKAFDLNSEQATQHVHYALNRQVRSVEHGWMQGREIFRLGTFDMAKAQLVEIEDRMVLDVGNARRGSFHLILRYGQEEEGSRGDGAEQFRIECSCHELEGKLHLIDISVPVAFSTAK